MNDFDYENLQKKRVAQNARHRVNGSRSRKCTLPHDNMTEAQWKKMNGDVKTWDLDEPMTYEHFKEMAPAMKREYIRRLHERFGVGVCTISQDLFGLSKAALANYLKSAHGIKIGFGKGTKMNAAQRAVWASWIGRDQFADAGETVEEVPAQDVQSEPASTPPVDAEEDLLGETEAPAFCMDNLCVEWCGKFDAVAFMEQLRKLPFPDGQVKVRLEVKRG